MDGACSTHRRDEHYILNFSRKKLKRGDKFGDLGADGRILKLILRNRL